MPCVHLLDVTLRVKVVTILEYPTDSLGEFDGNGGLSRTRYAHDNERVKRICRSIFGHAERPAAAPSTSHVVSPCECARRAGKPSPAMTRATIACLSAPATRNSISRQDANVGNVR